jgi:hypothetical protein
MAGFSYALHHRRFVTTCHHVCLRTAAWGQDATENRLAGRTCRSAYSTAAGMRADDMSGRATWFKS